MLKSPKESIKKFSNELHINNHLPHLPRHSNHANLNPLPYPAGNDLGAINLARQYESDKQKLIQYCFSRYEADGTLYESYITHVRILEDSHYPSSKPPPGLNPSHKKTRILSLAVKRLGPVRLHKGRENPNGSFQIGRTWNLEELREIHIDKTGDCGMLLNLGKSYYWATNTPKERIVFIKSVCNIYNKFTKGRLPVLIDFDPQTYGDIIALGNGGQPATLKYTPDGMVPAPIPAAPGGPRNQTTSTYSTNKNVLPPRSGGSVSSPLTDRETSFSALSNPHQGKPKLQHLNTDPYKPGLQAGPKSSMTPRTPMSFGKLKIAEEFTQRVTSPPPPLSFKSPSMMRLDSPKKSSQPQLSFKSSNLDLRLESSSFDEKRAAIKNDIMQTGKVADRQELKNDLNEFDNSGIENSKPKQYLSPGKIFDSPTLDGFSEAKSNRSSIIDVEFVSKRSLQEPVRKQEGDDDSAGVINEINRQRTLRKKSSMNLRGSVLEEKKTSEPVPELPKPVVAPAAVAPSIISSSESEDDMVEDELPEVQSNGIFDDTVVDDSRPSLLARDTTPLEELFEEIDWSSQDSSRQIQAKLTRALFRTEHESISALINISSNFGEIDQFVESSIEQCEKLDPMLTFFQVELNGFGDEIGYIETQSGGLQVKTANKKLLWNDLKDILSNVSLSNDELKLLTRSQISRDPQVIRGIETVLVNLYSALKTIRGGSDRLTDLGGMRALTERSKVYEKYSQAFLNGLDNTLVQEFGYLYEEIDSLVRQALGESIGNGGSLDVTSLIKSINEQFSHLLVYGGFTLYAKEISHDKLVAVMDNYQHHLRKSFNDLIENFLKFNLKILTKMLGPKFQYRFQFDYRLNKANLVVDGQQKVSSRNVVNLFDLDFSEILFDKIYGVIRLVQSLILQQQHFIGDFFHLNDLQSLTFDEYVRRQQDPQQRIAQFLRKRKDGDAGRSDDNDEKAETLIDNIFFNQIQSTVKFLSDFAGQNLLLLPVVILIIDNSIDKLRNGFIVSSFLKKVSNRFKNIWYNYNQEQAKIIGSSLLASLAADQKVSVLFAVKLYPQIVKYIEKLLRLSGLPKLDIDHSSVRLILDTTYEDYNRVLVKSFEDALASAHSLVNGKRRASRAANSRVEARGYVNIIVNSNYLVETFERSDVAVVGQLRQQLTGVYKDSLRPYVEIMIQNSLGKLVEFVEGIESLAAVDPTNNHTYSRASFQKLVGYYTKQEVQKEIQASWNKIEADFAMADDPEELLLVRIKQEQVDSVSDSVVSKVWKSLENEYILVYKRLEGVKQRHYRDVDLEVNRNNLIPMFSKVGQWK